MSAAATTIQLRHSRTPTAAAAVKRRDTVMRPVLNFASGSPRDDAHGKPQVEPVDDAQMLRVLSIIQGNGASSPSGSQIAAAHPPASMPTPIPDWSASLGLIEQMGRSVRDGHGRIRELETQMQAAAEQSTGELDAAQKRIKTLEEVAHEYEERERELKERLHNAEHWLARIQAALLEQTGDQLSVPAAHLVLKNAVDRQAFDK